MAQDLPPVPSTHGPESHLKARGMEVPLSLEAHLPQLKQQQAPAFVLEVLPVNRPLEAPSLVSLLTLLVPLWAV